MGLGQLSQLGHLGDNPFLNISVDLSDLLTIHGVVFAVTRHSTSATRDIYGEPQDHPAPFNATLLLVEQDMKEKPTEAGGKRQEVLTLIGQPGTLLENDILAHSGHNYDVYSVFKSTLDSSVQCDVYQATREVDVG